MTQMSECLALDPSPLPGEAATKPAPRMNFGAMFKAVLESLVAAQTRRFESAGPLMYRFPPL
jgi:hypothetical protein